MRGKVFITRTKPEVALVSWQVRLSPTICPIHDDPGLVCDLCNHGLDWEPFAVIDLPGEEKLQDPDYFPAGGTAMCTACAMKFYRLTSQDVGKVERVWLCYECVEHKVK